MFPKSRINMIYRLLCLISFAITIYVVDSIKTLMILFFAYCMFALCEKSFRNIELIVISIVILGICYLLDGYALFKVMLMIDYAFYYLDTNYESETVEKPSKKEYLRFVNKKKKKGSNNIIAIYLTVHLVILFLAIWVG